MRKITLEEFEQRIKNRFPTESFKIINYQSLGQPLDIQCEACKQIIHVSQASNFLIHSKVYGCKNCHGLWRQREKDLQELQKYYIIVKTEVKNTHTYYTVKCKQCGHERRATLKGLMKHLQCGCITNTKRNRSAQEFLNETNQHSRFGSYELVSEYINQITPVLLRHDCGFIWKVRPGDVIYGRTACPRCARKQSKGEAMVASILQSLNILYEQEKKLANSRQRFDFYFELNNQAYAIEYNGEQHYKDIDFFQTSLEETQTRDLKKAAYCKINNIILIIIPYWVSKEEAKNIIVSSTTIS